MAVTRLAVRIGGVTGPAGRRWDAEELRRRVEAELGWLLEREPVALAPGEARIELPGGRVRTASAATPAAVAYAIARHVHAGLREGEARR